MVQENPYPPEDLRSNESVVEPRRLFMPMRTEPKAIASRCLAAWSSGDLDTTRSLLHDDVVFTGPLGATG